MGVGECRGRNALTFGLKKWTLVQLIQRDICQHVLKTLKMHVAFVLAILLQGNYLEAIYNKNVC